MGVIGILMTVSLLIPLTCITIERVLSTYFEIKEDFEKRKGRRKNDSGSNFTHCTSNVVWCYVSSWLHRI